MSPVAIVTASDSGIGQESAKALAESGFDIGITYHEDEAGARETLDAVEAAGRRGAVRHLDLTVLPDAADVVDELADSLGGVDVLVNNAVYRRSHRRVHGALLRGVDAGHRHEPHRGFPVRPEGGEADGR